MSELLESIRSEIHERLEACRAAVEESARLEAALAVLGESTSTPEVAASAPAPRRRRKAAAPTSRAPRGANRSAVLAVLEQRPGVSVAELASASGVKKPVLYGLLSTLVEEGAVVKEDLPIGTTGYSLPRPADEPGWTSAPTPEPAAAAEEEPEAEPAEPPHLAEAA